MTKEQFLKDVANHRMTVLRDDGLYRHLKCKSAGDHPWNQWFEIVTWPNHLTIAGDMGTWCFSRIEDMFEFFRLGSDGLRINQSYWAEKLEAGSRRDGGSPRAFCGETFRAALIDGLDGYSGIDSKRAAIIEELDEIDFTESEDYVRREVYDFKCGDFQFQDTWEISGEIYVPRYTWCLYAIVWAIAQYDGRQAKPLPAAPAPDSQHDGGGAR